MRHILRKVAAGRPDRIGDASTPAYPSLVENLLDSSFRIPGSGPIGKT